MALACGLEAQWGAQAGEMVTGHRWAGTAHGLLTLVCLLLPLVLPCWSAYPLLLQLLLPPPASHMPPAQGKKNKAQTQEDTQQHSDTTQQIASPPPQGPPPWDR